MNCTKKCYFYVKLTFFWSSGVRPCWPKVRPYLFGQISPKVRSYTTCSVENIVNVGHWGKKTNLEFVFKQHTQLVIFTATGHSYDHVGITHTVMLKSHFTSLLVKVLTNLCFNFWAWLYISSEKLQKHSLNLEDLFCMIMTPR